MTPQQWRALLFCAGIFFAIQVATIILVNLLVYYGGH